MLQPKTEIYALPSRGCPCCLEYADLNVTTNEADAGGNNSGGNTTTGTTRASAEMPVAYPVPATSVVVLPYFLKQGEETTMMIYDQTGKLVEQHEYGMCAVFAGELAEHLFSLVAHLCLGFLRFAAQSPGMVEVEPVDVGFQFVQFKGEYLSHSKTLL